MGLPTELTCDMATDFLQGEQRRTRGSSQDGNCSHLLLNLRGDIIASAIFFTLEARQEGQPIIKGLALQKDMKTIKPRITRVHLRDCLAGMLSRFSHVRLLETLWTVARQTPLSTGFPRKVYWSGLPWPLPGIFLTQGSNWRLPQFLHCKWTLYCWTTGKIQRLSIAILRK